MPILDIFRFFTSIFSMGRPKPSGKPMKSNRHRKLKTFDQKYVELWRNDGSSKPGGERKGKPQNVARSTDQGVNQRPKASDDDFIPRSLKTMMEGKSMVKNMKPKRRKKKGPVPEHLRPIEKGMTRPVQPAPKFVQRNGEPDWAFVERMNNETEAVIAQTKFESKFGIEVNVGKDGEVNVMKKPNSKSKLKAKKRLLEKKQRDKERKNIKKLSKKTGFEILTDDVKFGEVAMAPPNLSKKPRGAPKLEVRPGRKNLLLKDIIHNAKTPEHESSQKVREIGKTIKRKHLSVSEQRKLDSERERVVELYKKMKAKKYGAVL